MLGTKISRQDAVEFKIPLHKTSFPKLEGYLYKRDPTGVVKEWKK
jgi:hypothetical protein